MSSPTHTATTVRSRAGRLWKSVVALSLLTPLTLLAPPPEARADSAVAPSSGTFTIRGAGYGHGHGMSQYGAYGAAQKGRTWKQILAFYYPGTTLSAMPARTSIKVWLTADSDSNLRVQPTPGLTVTDGAGGSYRVPTGRAYTSWRISRRGDGYQLAYRNTAGTWKARATGLGTGTWTFSSSAKVLALVLPSGSVREYRGSLALVKRGTGGRSVNRVSLEDYVRAVVPAEMPTSWAADAVRAQSVAARSYAVRTRDFSSSPGYDICDTTTCQVYGGKRSETDRGDAAVKATAGQVLRYRGAVALTQFASSNGGALAASNLPYLVAKPDPYDGVVTSQAWTRTISAASVARVWPSVGAVTSLRVTSRDGSGPWGGRVERITITGSRGSVAVGGSTFQYRFGMRSSLYTVVGATTDGSTPAPPPPPATLEPGPAYASHPRTYSSTSKADLALVSGGTLYRYPVRKGVLKERVALGGGFGSATHVLHAGDWNGDGYQDVIARSSDGTLLLHRGTATGRLAAGVRMGFGRGVRALAAVGDVTGDRKPDLVSISPAGNLWLHAGNGRNGRASLTKLASGWQDHQTLRGPGDLTGDGRPDLLTTRGDRLYLHPGRASGGFSAPARLGTGWSAYAALTAVGDLTGDGRGDLVARTVDGRLVLFRGDGNGGLDAGSPLTGNYRGTRFAI